MNNQKKRLAIYSELRDQVGGIVPAHELLSAADKLVDLFNEKNERYLSAFGTPRSTRDEWAVDKMISDGGWISLSRDPLMCDATDDDPYFPVRMAYQNNGYGVVSLP